MKSLLLASALFLAACTPPNAQTVRQAVAGMATTYAVTEIAFKAYAGLPRCSVAVPQPCSDAAKVVQIGTGLIAARSAVDLARTVANSLPEAATLDAAPAEQRAALDGAAAAVGRVSADLQGATR